MKTGIRLFCLGAWTAALCGGSMLMAQETSYSNDFEKAEVDKVPEDLLVIDGGFSVKQDSGNKFIELPGAPLDTFGLLFGPTFQDNATASARVFGTGKGRRFPTFSVGLGGVGGYRLQVSPGKKQVELLKGDAVQAATAYEWGSGKWTNLRVSLVKVQDGKWRVDGKVWNEGEKEPEKAVITFESSEAPNKGRPSLFGMPYSGTPIRFDDLSAGPAVK